jgi:formaldehyde-activating enzyme involved in methanogenesis
VGSDGASFAGTMAITLTTAFTNLVNSMSSAGYPMVVASRKNLSTTPITLIRVSPTLATQRHRLRA